MNAEDSGREPVTMGEHQPPARPARLGAFAPGPAGRVPVTLACNECKARNYKTTKTPEHSGKALEIKKYCKQCKHHTLHRETK